MNHLCPHSLVETAARTAAHHCGVPALAGDIANDVMLVALGPGRSYLSSLSEEERKRWVFRFALYKAINYGKSESRCREMPQRLAHESQAAVTPCGHSPEGHLAAKMFLDQLDAELHRTLEVLVENGGGRRQAARELGVAPGTVYARLDTMQNLWSRFCNH